MTIIVCLFILFYVTSVLPTRWLKVERVSMPLAAGCKILQISDLHVERNRISPSRLHAVIDEERPDVICLTGDFLDWHASFILLVPWLKMLQITGIPTYAVLGNHDYGSGQPEALKFLLEAFGIIVLINETVVLDKFNLVGLDDFCTRHSDESIFASTDREKPVVVMTHDPTITLFMDNKFDYLFAGHLHGKQFAVPFLFHLTTMGPLAASGVYQGLHQCGKGTFYISKGVGQSGINLRFLVRSEVTVHEL